MYFVEFEPDHHQPGYFLVELEKFYEMTSDTDRIKSPPKKVEKRLFRVCKKVRETEVRAGVLKRTSIFTFQHLNKQ